MSISYDNLIQKCQPVPHESHQGGPEFQSTISGVWGWNAHHVGEGDEVRSKTGDWSPLTYMHIFFREKNRPKDSRPNLIPL